MKTIKKGQNRPWKAELTCGRPDCKSIPGCGATLEVEEKDLFYRGRPEEYGKPTRRPCFKCCECGHINEIDMELMPSHVMDNVPSEQSFFSLDAK